MLLFESDKNKEQKNIAKHGISFKEALTVFYDEEALIISNPGHSQEEERFILLGLSKIEIH